MVRPFPFAQLPRWRAAEAARARAVLRRLAPVARAPREALPAATASWRALLGGEAWAAPLAPAVGAPAAVRDRYDGRALACVMDHPALGPIAALLDAPFALALAARALGADDAGARRAAAARSYPPGHEGALALLCAQAAVLASAPSPPPTVRAVTERAADALEALLGAHSAAPGASDALLVWPWRVTVGAVAGEVALLVRADALLGAPQPDAGAGRALADAVVRGELIAAREALAAGELAALFEGDVLALEGGALALSEGGQVHGEMVLALGEAWVPVTCSREGRITVAGAARAKGSGAVESDAGSQDDSARTGAADAAGEPAMRTEVLTTLPVEVEVVLARGAFAVGEVAAWRVGEVLALPTPLGEPVLVRAGGRPVARGELCDVDGAVGVRVMELL